MPPPNITAQALHALLPSVQQISAPRPPSGQKLVFPCKIGGADFVLKVLECSVVDDRAEGNFTQTAQSDEVYSRAAREVAILQSCSSPHLPKIGPIGLQEIQHVGKRLILFSEEFIFGKNLDEVLQTSGHFSNSEAATLAQHVTIAIDALWRQGKIHRDIKPANIMRRTSDGSYVLLDPGIAFDQQDNSITGTGLIPHTPGYIAPELTNAAAKRNADVRADLFLLGIVLYVVLTGQHPFVTRRGQNGAEIVGNILNFSPESPHRIRPEISQDLSAIVMRLLQKQRHLRFRTCEKLLASISTAEII